MKPYILTNPKKEEYQTLANPPDNAGLPEELKGLLHIPVMHKEVISFLSPKPGMLILDATVGVGGHSKIILEKLGEKGRLIGIDQDEKSLEMAAQALKECGNRVNFVRKFEQIQNMEVSNRVKLIKANFQNLDIVLKNLNIDKVNGVLFDLGVSNFQLSCSDRGFSIKHNGPLDMRMDTSI